MKGTQPKLATGGVASRGTIKETMSNNPRNTDFKPRNCNCGKIPPKK